MPFTPFSEQYYLYILDILHTKLFKPSESKKKQGPKFICNINFDTKAIKSFRLSSVVNHPDIISILPQDLRENEDIPVIPNKLGIKIRNKRSTIKTQ